MSSFLKVLKILRSVDLGLIEQIFEKIRELVVLLRRLLKVNGDK